MMGNASYVVKAASCRTEKASSAMTCSSFVGDNIGGDPARRCADRFGIGRIGGMIEFEAEPVQPVAYSGADQRLMLADAGRKDDGVQATQRPLQGVPFRRRYGK